MMLNSCSICGWPMHEEQSRFYFHKLPAWHALSKYHGTVHIDCLRALPNKEDVSKSLADFCESFYGKDSPTPIVARERNFVVKNCVKDGACFEIYDFDDFAEFFIPVHAISGATAGVWQFLATGCANASGIASFY